MKKFFTKFKLTSLKRTVLSVLALVVAGVTNPLKAQFPASSYGFSALSSTYTELSATATAITAIQSDDALSASLPIGFNFNFCGIDYTNFKVSSNGWLTFNTTLTGSSTFNDVSSLTQIQPGLMPLWDDLNGNAGLAFYEVTGTAPNRVLTVECRNWRWNWSSSYPPTISFQIKLYEGTNVIEYVYRQEAGTGNTSGSSGASIGIVDGHTPSSYLNINNASATPTASSATFTTNITTRPATGQLYRFTPPVNCSTATGLPTAGTITASPTSICLSGNVNLVAATATPIPAVTGLTYAWERSVDGGVTWTPDGTSSGNTYSTTVPVTVNNTIFRYKLMCNTTALLFTSASSSPVIVNSPGTVTVTPATRCGPGQVQLGATPVNAGNGVVWYQNATGGLPLGTGNTFTTPYLPTSTTYYAAASSTTATPVPPTWVGTGTTSNSTPNPYYTTFWGIKNQFLVRASEMTAAGLTAGTITSLSFQTTGSFSMNLTNFSISMGATTLTAMPAAYQTGLTNVYTNASYVPVLGLNTHTLTTPFVWDGASNIIIETCFNNSAWSGGFSAVGQTYSYNASYYGYADNATVCTGAPSSYNSTFRPNIRFELTAGCQGPRQAVTATVAQGSPVTKVSEPVICNNAVTPITVTLPTNGQYLPYRFYPITDLYTDAAGTIPYTGAGNTTTVYFKSTTSGQHTIYAVGGDTTVAASVCSRADTFNIWVQPGGNTIKAQPDTICVSGTTKLTLTSDTNYYTGSIQWQQSTDGGATYTNIAGATGISYTTAVLTANRKYRAVISAGANTCQTIDKDVFVVTPTMSNIQGGDHCGPGSVALNALPGNNASIRWYENATGGQPLAMGNTFNTPNINTTTTYYVASGVGPPPAPPTWVGTGTTSNSSPNPYYTTYWGSKNQFLIRASEMTAAGLSAGPINAISFQTTGSFSMNLTNYTVRMGATNLTAMPAAYQTGLTTVYTNASYTPVLGLNTHTLTTPFVWDGSSNIIIETCFNNAAWSGGFSAVGQTYSYNATYYGYGDNATVCSGTPTYNYTSTFRPNIRFEIGGGCETPRQPVVATINPFPIVDLGSDLDTCVDIGLSFTVDAAPQPNNATYLWDDGATTSTRLINQSGTYHVAVTNQFGCLTNDTLFISIKDNPVVDLGANGTNLCEGGVKILDAGADGENGGSYYWNTGATSRTISVTNSGSYIAFVTSPEGCLQVDTVNITVNGQMPTTDGITSSPLGALDFNFAAINPQHIVEYIWDFGDGSAPRNTGTTPNVSNPPHTFPGDGVYWVKLTTNSVCGQAVDSMMITIVGVGINNVNKNVNVKVYPNPTDGQNLTLETEGDVRISEVSIYNIVGQQVYHNTKMQSNNNKHQINLSSHLPAGMYNIRMQTNKGVVHRKLEILK